MGMHLTILFLNRIGVTMSSMVYGTALEFGPAERESERLRLADPCCVDGSKFAVFAAAQGLTD